LANLGRPGCEIAARGSLAGRISIDADFEFTDQELDAVLDEPT